MPGMAFCLALAHLEHGTFCFGCRALTAMQTLEISQQRDKSFGKNAPSFPLRLLCVAWGVVRKCIALNELPWNTFVCLKD